MKKICVALLLLVSSFAFSQSVEDSTTTLVDQFSKYEFSIAAKFGDNNGVQYLVLIDNSNLESAMEMYSRLLVIIDTTSKLPRDQVAFVQYLNEKSKISFRIERKLLDDYSKIQTPKMKTLFSEKMFASCKSLMAKK